MSYQITPRHRAVLERDIHRKDEENWLLKFLAIRKIEMSPYLNVSDFSCAQCVELGKFEAQGFVTIVQDRDAADYGCIDITDDGLHEVFVKAL